MRERIIKIRTYHTHNTGYQKLIPQTKENNLFIFQSLIIN